MFKKKSTAVPFYTPIQESAEILLSNIANGNVLNEEILTQSLSASLKKNNISSDISYNLNEVVEAAILQVQVTHFLSHEQKTKFTETLKDLSHELKNPYGQFDKQISELLSLTQKVENNYNDESNKEDMVATVVELNKKIKSIKLINVTNTERSLWGKVSHGLVGLLGLIYNGILFNMLVIFVLVALAFLKNPEILERFL